MERFHPGQTNAKTKQKQTKGPGWKDSIQVKPTQKPSKNKPKGLDGKIPSRSNQRKNQAKTGQRGWMERFHPGQTNVKTKQKQ